MNNPQDPTHRSPVDTTPDRTTPDRTTPDEPDAAAPGRSTEEIIEDLRVHQVELEVQLEELRRAEAQISAMGDRYRQLFNRAPVPLMTLDEVGVIVSANEAATELLAPGSHLDGKPLVLFVVADDHAALRPIIRHRGEEPRDSEVTFRDRLGIPIACRVTASAVDVAAPDRGAVLLSLEDRREHDRLVAVLAESERSTAIRQLTGGIAHDFNNLLTVIGGNLSLLETEVDAEPGLRWLTAAHTATDRGARLVAQLLTYARTRRLDPEPCHLDVLLTELQPLLDSAVGATIVIRITVSEGLPAVEVDPTHLQTALLNLAINSRDARAGEVVLTAEVDERGEVVVTVTDDGDGMTSEVLAAATTPFFTTKASETATGLGLAMVASFAEATGGALRLDAEVGVGTRVTLTLPRATRAPGSLLSTATESRERLDGLRILLVEDQEQVRAVTAALLQARGAEVVEVAEVTAALEQLQAGPIDVVLSDVVLGPGRNGFDLRRELEQREHAPGIVLVSGYADVTEDVLRKPFTANQLVAAVRAARPEPAGRAARS